MNTSAMKKQEAFTLIEVLVVVALIAILAAITIIAINPAKSFRDTRNSQRASDVNAILNAVTQYNAGTNTTPGDLGIPACGSADADTDGVLDGAQNIGTDVANVDLSGPELVEDYIVGIPIDPAAGFDDTDTGYLICETDGGRVTVYAPSAEGTSIEVSR